MTQGNREKEQANAEVTAELMERIQGLNEVIAVSGGVTCEGPDGLSS